MKSRDLLRVLGGTTGARPFNVRVVRFGECYGRDDCITHTLVDAAPPRHDGRTTIRSVLVEFYDASNWATGPRGQFVSRYFLDTLRGDTTREGFAHRGLNLDGGIPVWCVTARAVERAIAYADGIVAALGDGASNG